MMAGKAKPKQGDETVAPGLLQIEYIPIDKLKPNGHNPFGQDAATFDALVASMDETKVEGGIDPLDVIPDPGSPGEFLISDGEHRWKAARVRGDHAVPCVVHEGWSLDDLFFNMMRKNMIRGALDKDRLLKLIPQLKGTYDKSLLWRLMGFSAQEQLERLIGKAKKSLPAGMQPKFDAAKKEIKTIDALGDVLNRIFNEQGSTLERGFLSFTYGGQCHYLIEMNEALLHVMVGLEQAANQSGRNMAEIVREKLGAGG